MLAVGRAVYDKVTCEPIRLIGLNIDITERKANKSPVNYPQLVDAGFFLGVLK